MRGPGFVRGVAESLQCAFSAARFARYANLSSVMDKFVREGDPVILGYDAHQVLLHFFGRSVAGEAEAVREAQDVGIDDNAYRFLIGHPEDHVSGFAGYSGKGQELVHRAGNLAMEFADEAFGCAGDGLRLVVVEAGGANLFLNGFKRRRGKVGGRGEPAEERWRDHVHADVGTLRRENGGHEEFPWAAMMKSALGVGVSGDEYAEDLRDARGGQVGCGGASGGFWLRG